MMNKAGAPESRDTVPLYEHVNAASMGFKQAITESLKNLHARTTVRTVLDADFQLLVQCMHCNQSFLFLTLCNTCTMYCTYINRVKLL